MDIAVFAVFCAIGLPILVCAFILLSFIFTRYKERITLIKQGIVPHSIPRPAPNKYIALRNGFICIGIALGLIIGLLIENSIDVDDNTSSLIIISSTLFFLGFSYLIFFFIVKNKDLDE